MSLIKKVKAVNQEFENLEQAIQQFKTNTGLGCVAGCGKCCEKPSIEACVLEFLPLALEYYRQGMALEKWEELKKNPPHLCTLFSPVIGSQSKGFCQNYTHRGLICRLFGFSAMRNKHGEPTLYTCQNIKQTYASEYQAAEKNIKRDLPIPVVSDYYRRLANIDPHLGQCFLPINEAICRALEEVLQYYAYRKPPKAKKKDWKQAG